MGIKEKLKAFNNSPVFKNSMWGLTSSALQNILLSLFFIMVARKFSTFDFAQFLIATALYQIVSAFSTLGLGQWFIREYLITNDKKNFLARFLKIQTLSGLFFYLINIALVYLIYPGPLVRELALILGINVIFDNLIFAIKNLNTAEFQQKKTFIILLIDAVVRCLIGVSLFIFKVDIVVLSLILIISRFTTLNLFIKIGVQNNLGLPAIWSAKISASDLKKLLAANWSFIVIGIVSVIYWRVGSLVISKLLTAADVANYEVSFKVFLLAQLVPLILSASVFPTLVKLAANPDPSAFNNYYKKFFLLYACFGFAAYTFIYAFAGTLMPLAFGAKFAASALCTQQMFLTMLVFPTVFLQGNVLIAMKMEKADMWINMGCMLVYLCIGAVLLYFDRSLASINYAIFASFVLIHILQDSMLVKHGVSNQRDNLFFYLMVASLCSGYLFLSQYINAIVLFFSFWALVLLILLIFRFKQQTTWIWRNQL